MGVRCCILSVYIYVCVRMHVHTYVCMDVSTLHWVMLYIQVTALRFAFLLGLARGVAVMSWRWRARRPELYTSHTHTQTWLWYVARLVFLSGPTKR